MSAISSVIKARIIIVGKEGSGKSSLIQTVIGSGFSDAYTPTKGCDLHEFEITEECTNSEFHVFLWDTCGSAAYETIIRQYYTGASCAIITCESADFQRNLHEAVVPFIDGIREYCGPIPLIIAVTKSDLSDPISIGEEESLFKWKNRDIPIMHTSSRSGSNVLTMFKRLLLEVVRYQQLVGIRIDTPIHKLEDIARML